MEATDCSAAETAANRSTAESATDRAATNCRRAAEAAANWPAHYCTGPSNKSWTAIEAGSTIETWPAIPAERMPAVEPRARADEDATDEPIRAVVAEGAQAYG